MSSERVSASSKECGWTSPRKRSIMNKLMIIKEVHIQINKCSRNNDSIPRITNPDDCSPLKKLDENTNLGADLKAQKAVKDLERTDKKIKGNLQSKEAENDSLAIIDSIVNNDEVKVSFPLKGKPSAVYRRTKNTKVKEEKEVRLFTEEEKNQYESISVISECPTEKSAFVVAASKTGKRQNGVKVPQTKLVSNKKKNIKKKRI